MMWTDLHDEKFSLLLCKSDKSKKTGHEGSLCSRVDIGAVLNKLAMILCNAISETE